MRGAACVVVLVASCLAVCTDDWDCSLAGQCVKGRCVCEPWTEGASCATLSLAPLHNTSELVSAIQPQGDWTRWGASVVEENGKFHMFSAEMASHCGLSVWGFKSTVVHSVGDTAAGPFRRIGVAIGAEAHNPVLSRAPDGTWLIWTCGCPQSSSPPDCKHEAVTCPGGAAAPWTTTVYSSASLDGPWVPHVDVLGDLTKGRLGSQNVVPWFEDDGSVVLLFKGPDNNTEASIATAPHWQGPYTMVATNIWAQYYTLNITVEDAWLWKSSNGVYHALTHRMTPSDRGSAVCGGHGYARTLTNWSYAIAPAYTTEVALSTGGVARLKRRERPQLLFFANSSRPAVLYNGVVDDKGNTFTFAQKFN